MDEHDYDRFMRSVARRAYVRLAALPLIGLRGFREAEIRELELRLGRPLPAAYRAFLRKMGRSAGSLFGDVTLTFDGIGPLVDLQATARDAAQEAGSLDAIPPGAFFFDSYLDTQFGFFVSHEDDDPMTFNFEGGNPSLDPPVPCGRFTEVIRSFVEG